MEVQYWDMLNDIPLDTQYVRVRDVAVGLDEPLWEGNAATAYPNPASTEVYFDGGTVLGGASEARSDRGDVVRFVVAR